MTDTVLHALSVPFALVAGTGAAVLAALSWYVSRASPTGSVFGPVTAAMAVITAYHVVPFAVGPESVAFELLRGGAYVAVAALVAVAIRGGRRSPAAAGQDPGSLASDRRSLALVAGPAAFVVVGPVVAAVLPAAVHWAHGMAAILVVVGLFAPLRDDHGPEAWSRPLPTEPDRSGRAPDWMRPMDDEVLALLQSSDLVLTPAVVATNIGCSRGEVNRRMRTLETRGFLTRVERGKYRLADRGERYLRGTLRRTEATGADGD